MFVNANVNFRGLDSKNRSGIILRHDEYAVVKCPFIAEGYFYRNHNMIGGKYYGKTRKKGYCTKQKSQT
jgi:hypothetical protein